MSSYRAELTIWHSIWHSAIFFSNIVICTLRRCCFLIDHFKFYLFFFASALNVEIIYFITLSSLFSSRGFSSFSSSCTHYGLYSFDKSLFRHLRTSHWSLITRRSMNSLKETFETLSEEFSRICMLVFTTMKSNLEQKIQATSTRYSEIHMKKVHNQNTRRRSFDWKERR